MFAEHVIVEYHPVIFDENGFGTGEHDMETTEFHVYTNGKDICKSSDTIEWAVVAAIAVKYDGINTRADNYFMKMIKD